MYEPVFNSVLVQIDDKDAKWGSGNDESMLGASYSKGKVIRVSETLATKDYPIAPVEDIDKLEGQQVLWNEGHEAGTIFEFAGKKFGFIYWWDIRGILVNPKAKK